MKKNIYLAALVGLMILGPSACGLFQTCPEALPYFQIEGIDLEHYRFNDDAYGDPVVPNAKTTWQEYGLRTDFRASYLASQKETAGGSYLYALSCVEDGYMGTKVGFDTLYLITKADYNANFAADDTLNTIIQMNDWFLGTGFYNPQDYKADNSESIRSEYFTIKLTEGPSQDTALQFDLVYVLTSGEEFRKTSDIVNLRQ